MNKLSQKDAATVATAAAEADALVETLRKMVGADDGLLSLHAQDLQSQALAIQGKLRLIETLTSEAE
jgi:hypothetical protein